MMQTVCEAGGLKTIILGDNQIVFRAGAAQALAASDEAHVVAQCENPAQLLHAVQSFPNSIVIFASSMLAGAVALGEMAEHIAATGNRAILITENGEPAPQETLKKVDGAVSRSVSGAELVECVHRVARGQRPVLRSGGDAAQLMDNVGARVRDRLTPKEMQIVALVVRGYKNREIAELLETKEQVIKNYLRSVYDKTGVSDRLELALFTVHHRILAEAAARAVHQIEQKRSN